MDNIKITAKTRKAANRLNWIVRYVTALEDNLERINGSITPFLTIMSFVIVLPYLKSLTTRFIFCFVILVVVAEVVVSSIKSALSHEMGTEMLIRKNKDEIHQLEKDIKRLRKKVKLKNKKQKEVDRK